MVDLAFQAHMTDALTVPRSAITRTVVGMAHFAGSGPVGELCGGCSFWQSPPGKKILICEKYRQLTGAATKAIPAGTPACRHFVARPK